jgi:hypothetical protein
VIVVGWVVVCVWVVLGLGDMVDAVLLLAVLVEPVEVVGVVVDKM